MVAEVSPSTASVHLNRLKVAHLVKVLNQGKHRFYSMEAPDVANALEGLSVLAGVGDCREKFVSNAASGLRAARTCYDPMAGTTGASLHYDSANLMIGVSGNVQDLSQAHFMMRFLP